MNATLQFAYSVEAEDFVPNFQKYAAKKPQEPMAYRLDVRVNGQWVTKYYWEEAKKLQAEAKKIATETRALTRIVRCPQAEWVAADKEGREAEEMSTYVPEY